MRKNKRAARAARSLEEIHVLCITTFNHHNCGFNDILNLLDLLNGAPTSPVEAYITEWNQESKSQNSQDYTNVSFQVMFSVA